MSDGNQIPILGKCSLGRDLSNSVVLPGHQVSRRHAMIHLESDEEYWLVDLGSRNGITLNGHRVTQPVALADKDRLELGGAALTFRHAPQNIQMGSATDFTAINELTVGEHRTARMWIMLADIKEFTPLSQTMPVEQLANMVGSWIVVCKRAVEANGGEINQYLGDGFLAYWPSPETTATQIGNTLKALNKLRYETTLAFRLVVHNGPITVDHSISLGKNSLIGPEVNFTFRMEKVAGKLGVDCMATAGAAEQLNGIFQMTALGKFELKGFEGSFPTFQVEIAD